MPHVRSRRLLALMGALQLATFGTSAASPPEAQTVAPPVMATSGGKLPAFPATIGGSLPALNPTPGGQPPVVTPTTASPLPVIAATPGITIFPP
jgi:hypothetical protein